MKKNDINNIEHILQFLSELKNGVYLWGAGETGKAFYQKYSNVLMVKGFIDSNACPGQILCGLPVYSADQIPISDDFRAVITIQTPAFIKEVHDILLAHGMIEHINFININRAKLGLDYLISGTLSLGMVELIITTRCTLNCKDCIQLMPYYKAPLTLSLKDVIRQAEATFNTIDYCQRCHIVGGEALLHSEIEQIVQYIHTHYAKQIGVLVVVTNGTIVPSEQLLQTIKTCEVQVEISNYGAQPDAGRKQKMQAVEDKLKAKGIPYVIRQMDTWFDFQGDGKQHSEKEIIQTFENCICAAKAFYIVDDRLYSCTRYGAAEYFGLIPKKMGNSLYLSKEQAPSKKEILEWCMGISDMGYLPCCQECTGSKLIFERMIPAAIQMERNYGE